MEAIKAIDTGDTAWVLISTALVLLMTPGLAFFYGGMTRTKSVVSTLFQNFAALGVVGLVWMVCGYTMAFGTHGSTFLGSSEFFFLRNVGQAPNADYAGTIPHSLFMMFQCMFAVITPILITGALAERIKFKSFLFFTALWSVLVYSPVAHWVWGVGGFIRNLGALDFAGGMVVHMTAGFSAVVAAILLGKRKDFGKENFKPYDLGMILLGTTLLWFGWFGFNAGSALAANGLTAHAFATTFFGSATAMLCWMLVESYRRGKPSLMGACVGTVAGLVAITPAAGFVSFGSAVIIGGCAGFVCNFAITLVKEKFGLDDSLDVVGCHGVGGTLGTLLTAVFADKSINPAGADGLIRGSGELMKAHLIGTGAVMAISIAGTFLIFKILDVTIGMRVSETDEHAGLDASQHDEEINSGIHLIHLAEKLKQRVNL